MAGLVLSAGATFAQPPAGEDARPSYWGPLPAESDSVRTHFASVGPQAWEWGLYAPWKVASLPFDGLQRVLKASYLGLERSGIAYQLMRLFGPIDIPYGFSVSGAASHLVGIGVGIHVYHDAAFGAGNRVQIKYGESSSGHVRTSFGYLRDVGDHSYFELGGGYRKRTNARYFGLGPGARLSRESFYTEEASWVGATVHQHLPLGLAAEATGMFTTMDSRGPERSEDDPSVETEFAGDRPYGYSDRSDGWQLLGALERDDTQTDGRPRNGGLQRVVVGYFAPSGHRVPGYAQYRAEVQQFLPLWYDRALALRGYVSWLGLPADLVPFQRLLTNDDPDVFRGYDDFRFRDRGILAFSAEYRYPAWAFKFKEGAGVDAYLFFDWGQVYGEREEIALRQLTESFGVGLRFVRQRGFSARVEVGFSEDETVYRLRTDQVFQFHKRGFYHGRTPVPPR